MEIWQQLVQTGLETTGSFKSHSKQQLFDASVDSHLLTVSQVLAAGPTN